MRMHACTEEEMMNTLYVCMHVSTYVCMCVCTEEMVNKLYVGMHVRIANVV